MVPWEEQGLKDVASRANIESGAVALPVQQSKPGGRGKPGKKEKCQHNKMPHLWWDCGGASICEHKRRRWEGKE